MKHLLKKYKFQSGAIKQELRDQLIADYAPLIRYIAQKIQMRLPPSIELDDLISSGIIGLIDAIEKYDPTRENKFKTYAEFRIRGSILDELRAQDWIPRSVRDKSKIIDRATSKLEQKLGRPADEYEISKEMGCDLDEYYTLINKVRSTLLISVEDLASSSFYETKSLNTDSKENNQNNPFTDISKKHLKSTLLSKIEKLPEAQRLVLSLYYFEDLNLKAIGKILNVTESRISQLHTQAVTKLRQLLDKPDKY